MLDNHGIYMVANETITPTSTTVRFRCICRRAADGKPCPQMYYVRLADDTLIFSVRTGMEHAPRTNPSQE